MQIQLFSITASFLAILLWAGCDAKKNDSADHTDHAHNEELNHVDSNHEEHGHEEHGHEEHGHEEHGHEEHGHEEHQHSENEGVVLNPKAQEIAGISIKSARRRSLRKIIELPGRIGYNEDRLMHITPRYGGVAHNVHVQQGQYVKTGDVLVEIESNQSMTTYAVKAPFSGYIVEKHVVPGEHVFDDREMFVLVDLSSVWVNCDVFASNMDYIQTGAKAVLHCAGAQRSDTGTVSYVAPHFNSSTNSGLVRIVLPNIGKQWRPGMFIRAQFEVALHDSVIAIERDAVQTLDGERVVFLPGPNNTFRNLPISLGRRAGEFIEVLSGLDEGEQYVANGAFEIKATIVTSGMDPHAGHGH